MDGKLFLGVADNNQYAVAVVGDSVGRIVATSVGGSVNHQYHGISQARDNLRVLLTRALGYFNPGSLEGACFTYKWDPVASDQEMACVIQGVLSAKEIRVENFVRSCTLGMNTDKDRMLLVGGQTNLVVFENNGGVRFQMREDPTASDLRRRLVEKLEIEANLNGHQELHELLELHQNGDLIGALDELARSGNPLALELIHEIAHDLVSLVIKMTKHFQSYDPVIGLYGQVLFGSRLVYERVSYLIEILFPQAQVKEATLAPAKGAYLSTLVNRKPYCEPEVISNSSLTWGNLEQRGWLYANGEQVAERNDQQIF